MTIREGDETKEMSTLEVVLRAQTKSAAGGNAYAQKHIIERVAWADRERRAEIEASNTSWREYVARHREAIAEAERNKESPPAPLPHPDDVVIDEEKGVRFVGPIDEAQMVRLKETLKLRDLLIMQDALDKRVGDDARGTNRPGTALIFASLINDSAPARFRLSEIEIIMRMMRYEGTAKRSLLKLVYRGWRELGRRVPRGYAFPPLRLGTEMAETLFDAIAEAARGEDTMPLAEETLRVFAEGFRRKRAA